VEEMPQSHTAWVLLGSWKAFLFLENTVPLCVQFQENVGRILCVSFRKLDLFSAHQL
jgi:hypothetical protein